MSEQRPGRENPPATDTGTGYFFQESRDVEGLLLSAKAPRTVSEVTAGGHFPSWQGLTDTIESEPGPANIRTHTLHTNTHKKTSLPSFITITVINHNII